MLPPPPIIEDSTNLFLHVLIRGVGAGPKLVWLCNSRSAYTSGRSSFRHEVKLICVYVHFFCLCKYTPLYLQVNIRVDLYISICSWVKIFRKHA